MRQFALPPQIAAKALKAKALSHETGVPLYLPAYQEWQLPARATPQFVEFDADDTRVEPGGVTISQDDDDFY